ncbi:MAG: sialidase family protein, partial [Lachnospiraceae bacterium]
MKRVISVILILVVILMSSACSKSNEGNQSKKPDAGMKEESNGYQKIPIQKPDDSPIVESICYLDNGVLRIVTADSNQLDVKIWDSKDNGITWEAATNVSDLIGNNPSQEPIVVALSSQGEMTIKQSVLYYVDNNKQAIEITESVPNAYDYKYAD